MPAKHLYPWSFSPRGEVQCLPRKLMEEEHNFSSHFSSLLQSPFHSPPHVSLVSAFLPSSPQDISLCTLNFVSLTGVMFNMVWMESTTVINAQVFFKSKLAHSAVLTITLFSQLIKPKVSLWSLQLTKYCAEMLPACSCNLKAKLDWRLDEEHPTFTAFHAKLMDLHHQCLQKR